MTREVLDTLPTGGDVWSIARLTPAIHMYQYNVGGRNMFGQSSASAHGSTERETFVDGMDVNQYGGTFYVDSYSFEELGMQTANVTAERSTGGVVWNFVTKTGTNRFMGTGAFLGMTHGCCESNNISPANPDAAAGRGARLRAGRQSQPEAGHEHRAHVRPGGHLHRSDREGSRLVRVDRTAGRGLHPTRRQLQRGRHATAERQSAEAGQRESAPSP